MYTTGSVVGSTQSPRSAFSLTPSLIFMEGTKSVKFALDTTLL